MKILFYLHQYPAFGGIETVTATLANALSDRGFQVEILSHVGKDTGCECLKDNQNIRYLSMPDADSYSAQNRRFLQSYISDNKFDIVIFQDSYARIERNLYPNTTQAKTVVVEHNSPFAYLPARQIHNFRSIISTLVHPFYNTRCYRSERIRRRFLYGNCDRYVLLSKMYIGEFRAIARLGDMRKIRAIPNPLELKKIGWENLPKAKEVVFAATLDNRKGCDLLLRAWESLGECTKGWRLRIAGDGPQREKLQREARLLGLENVSFEGYRVDIESVLARASIFALPSRREGFPLTLVEAMANGCVPVCFESYAAVYDIVDDAYNGYLVPAFDVSAYASRLKLLMEDSTMRENMSRNATTIGERYSVPYAVALWQELFDSMKEGK